MHYNAEEARHGAAAKLHPDSIKIAPFCHTIIARLLDMDWFPLCLCGLRTSVNGTLWGQFEGQPTMVALCDRQLLVNNILEISDVAGLTPRERTYILENIPVSTSLVRDLDNEE